MSIKAVWLFHDESNEMNTFYMTGIEHVVIKLKSRLYSPTAETFLHLLESAQIKISPQKFATISHGLSKSHNSTCHNIAMYFCLL